MWKALQTENSMLVCDFDGTLTTSGSSMHGIVRVLGEGAPITQARDSLYVQYGKRIKSESEMCVKKELAEKWWQEQMELFVRYNIPEHLFMEVGKILPPRKNAAALLKHCMAEKVPVWIVSAGIANVIECWMKFYGLSDDSVHILANRVLYKNERADGYSQIITPWNKAEVFLKTSKINIDQNLVFLGDRREDINWRSERVENFIINGQSVEVTFI